MLYGLEHNLSGEYYIHTSEASACVAVGGAEFCKCWLGQTVVYGIRALADFCLFVISFTERGVEVSSCNDRFLCLLSNRTGFFLLLFKYFEALVLVVNTIHCLFSEN